MVSVRANRSPSERLEARARVYWDVAEGMFREGHIETATIMFMRSAEFYTRAEHARVWEPFRYDRTDC